MTDDSDRKLPPGIYELPVTHGLAKKLEGLDKNLAESRVTLSDLSPDGEEHYLARLLYERLLHSLESLPTEDKLSRQIALSRRIMKLLQEASPDGGAHQDDYLVEPGQLLEVILPPPTGNLASIEKPVRPSIPLSASDLLINARQDLSVGPELRRELASADRVDLLCSFLKWTGVRVLEEAMRSFLQRRPRGLRVITTTYIGATDRRAMDALAEMGAQLKVSYDTGRTRLHAKAWLFHRESGFSTAYIGSSNLSAQALLDGLEWNVRLSKVDNAPILERFETAFAQYWADPEFQRYAGTEEDKNKFDKAIRREKGHKADPYSHSTPTSFIDVTARPYQQEILDDLAAERERGHKRNLVVAATGTGKTVVAALDYRRLAKQHAAKSEGSQYPSLLFVAHRQEILKQSQSTFQSTLRDGNFGELLVGGEVPQSGHHVFASIQSLSPARLEQIDPNAYDILIIDEFHHAAAASYDRLLAHLEPKYLLGLTATPERADGKSILHYFDDRIASELRLWKALDQGLLSPFQYFGLEGPDPSGVTWSRGRYDVKELSGVYTADHHFAKRIAQQLAHKVSEIHKIRALGFCVDIAHAEFMAKQFNEMQIASKAVSGQTPADERSLALQDLRRGKLRVLFSVDLFNEGVDLPDVDTLIFLRPTESATLFLQQLGRGLRRSEDKSCCTVLDFIGSANRKFRFDLRYRAIVGGTRRQVQRQVENEFPHLPNGCSIVLDKSSQKAVLDNIRSQLGIGQKGLVEDLQALGPDTTLSEFLEETGFELEDIYEKPGCTFSNLRRRAGFDPDEADEKVIQIEREFSRILHLDDIPRYTAFHNFLSLPSAPNANPEDPFQRMLYVLLGKFRTPFSMMQNTWDLIWKHPRLREELLQIISILKDRSRRVTIDLTGALGGLPLRINATYTQSEVMAAIDEQNQKGSVLRIQTGPHYVEKISCDLMFVTLAKSEKHYSPTTRYKDYPLTPLVFHWESQNSCHEGTKTGRRYQEILPGSGRNGLLFVRQNRTDARGLTMPYELLGPVTYLSHEGERPMRIQWALKHRMPARDFQEMKLAAG